jgi:hypothetical protein
MTRHRIRESLFKAAVAMGGLLLAGSPAADK